MLVVRPVLLELRRTLRPALGIAAICLVVGLGLGRVAASPQPTAGVPDEALVRALPQQEDEVPELYDDSVLREIEIVFDDADWQARLERTSPADPVDLPASLTVDGYTLERIGARYKGNTSRRVSSPKKPFNLTTDAFVAGEDLWGYDIVNLNNAASDPSMLREAVGYRILRDYMPVPKTSFARVSVQGDYLGVYLMVEQVNREMVDSWFPTNDGIVIKGDPAAGARLKTSALQWIGESLSRYEQFYEVKTEGSEEVGYEHLRELARALDAPVSQGGLADEGFVEAIREVIDVEAALWYLAGSNLIQNGDSYYAGHNYYMYETAEEPRFYMISWDLNLSFGIFALGGMGGGRPGPGLPREWADPAEQSPFYGEDSRDLPLIRRLLSDPETRADYVAHLRDLRDGAFRPENVERIALGYQDLIRESVREEPEPIFPFSQFTRNLRESVTAGGGPARNRTVPGVLTLARERYEYMLEHPDLQRPAVALAGQSLAPSAPTAADMVGVTAELSGDAALRSVQLRYRVEGGLERVVEMVPAGGSTWRATIPSQREGREVSYVFRVGLADGRAAFFPPATLTQPFMYRVAGVDLPRGEPGDLVLNELMAANDTTIADDAGEFDDWLELYNRGTSAVQLEGYYLSDDPADPWAFQLPDYELDPGGYLLVWCDNDEDQGALHAPFALSRDGESAVLATADEILDQVDFGEQASDVSFARAIDGGEPWMVCSSPSPGESNQCGPVPPTPTTDPSGTETPTAQTATATSTPASPTPTNAVSGTATAPTAEPTDTRSPTPDTRTTTTPAPGWLAYIPYSARR